MLSFFPLIVNIFVNGQNDELTKCQVDKMSHWLNDLAQNIQPGLADNETAHFEKGKKLSEYQIFLLLRDMVVKIVICIKILLIFSTPMIIRHL